MSAANSPLNKSAEPTIWNFKLLAQHDLGGFGGMGEGMSMQIAKDGRRIIWLAHESAPKNFTAVDVSDPRKPKVVVQTDLPQAVHALQLAGGRRRHHGRRLSDARKSGQKPAGLRVVRHLGAGKAALDLVLRSLGPDTRAACTSCGSATANSCTWLSGAPDFSPTQSARRPDLPLHRRAQSVEAGGGRALVDAGHQARRRRAAAAAPYPARHGLTARTTPTSTRSVPTAATSATSTAACSCSTFPTRRTRSRFRAGPIRRPIHGFTHTVLPLFDRNLLVVTDESTENSGRGLAEACLDSRCARRDNPVPISTCPLPPVDAFAKRGGRFGAHNIHENPPVPTAWQSDQIVHRHFLQRRPARLRHFQIRISRRRSPPSCRRAPKGAPAGAIQLNDVFVDERSIVYTVDRHTGGLYTLEMDF